MKTVFGKTVLTTGDVARACHVAPRTVSKWFDSGKLAGYRIPGGGDRRILAEDLLSFMQDHNIPIEGLSNGQPHVVIVTARIDELPTESDLLDIRPAGSAYQAGAACREVRPQAVVVDVRMGIEQAIALAGDLQADPPLADCLRLAAVPAALQSCRQRLTEGGFQETVSVPIEAEELVALLDRSLAVKS